MSNEEQKQPIKRHRRTKAAIQASKTGKLNNIEKYAIQGLLQDNQSVEDIAKLLNRTTTIITRYISTLDRIKENIVDIQSQQITKKLPDTKTPNSYIQQAVGTLMNIGISPERASELVQLGLAKHTQPAKTAEELTSWALQQKSPIDLMITQGSQGRKGVTIMTSAAAEDGDHNKHKTTPSQNLPRSARNAVYDIKKGKMV